MCMESPGLGRGSFFSELLPEKTANREILRVVNVYKFRDAPGWCGSLPKIFVVRQKLITRKEILFVESP